MSTRPTSAPRHGGTRRVTLVVPRLEAANVVATLLERKEKLTSEELERLSTLIEHARKEGR